MTDEQIIKALECCGVNRDCAGCPKEKEPYGCYFVLCGGALDLINRQKAEIERLQKQLKKGIDLRDSVFKIVKAEAIKEFAERVKDKIPKRCKMDGIDTVNVYIYIDNLVKEMTEPVKLEHNSLCETETYMGE